MADAGRRAARGINHNLNLAAGDGGERVVQDAGGPVFGCVRDGWRSEPFRVPADVRQALRARWGARSTTATR